MERAFLAGDALNDEPRVVINQNRHLMLPPFAAATTSSAASFIVAPTWKFNPDSCENLAAFFNVRAFEPQHNRHLHVQVARRRHHACRQPIHAQNAAEDIDEDRLHMLVRQQNPECMLNLLLRSAAAHIEEVCRDCRRRTE